MSQMKYLLNNNFFLFKYKVFYFLTKFYQIYEHDDKY